MSARRTFSQLRPARFPLFSVSLSNKEQRKWVGELSRFFGGGDLAKYGRDVPLDSILNRIIKIATIN